MNDAAKCVAARWQGMNYSTVSVTLALALALAACQNQSTDNIAIDEANSTANAPTEVETLPPSEPSGNASLPENTVSPGTQPDDPNQPVYEEKDNALIPAQYHGRWGMNANDCDPAKADIAKGLIVIDASSLKFYEARATLKDVRPAIATSFSANFAFSGEGMTWEKVETFTRTGKTLKRADKDGTFTYQRCT